jgi:hypothetical protein
LAAVKVLLNDGAVINNAGVFRFLNGDVISRNSGDRHLQQHRRRLK